MMLTAICRKWLEWLDEELGTYKADRIVVTSNTEKV
jgi:hypothetical protein